MLRWLRGKVATSGSPAGGPAWVFVSHASADIAAVRSVRNHLEERGAAPLLFHLRALSEPEEFWPLIEREIAARSFFLYCESAAAAQSEWVRRERDAVAKLARTRPVRIGSIQVDRSIDGQRLDEFLSTTRVFLCYSHDETDVVTRFHEALEAGGFQVFRDETSLAATPDLWVRITDAIDETLESAGWVVVFVTRRSMESEWVRLEVTRATANGGRVVPVLLEHVYPLPDWVGSGEPFDATARAVDDPQRLVAHLLERPFA